MVVSGGRWQARDRWVRAGDGLAGNARLSTTSGIEFSFQSSDARLESVHFLAQSPRTADELRALLKLTRQPLFEAFGIVQCVEELSEWCEECRAVTGIGVRHPARGRRNESRRDGLHELRVTVALAHVRKRQASSTRASREASRGWDKEPTTRRWRSAWCWRCCAWALPNGRNHR